MASGGEEPRVDPLPPALDWRALITSAYAQLVASGWYRPEELDAAPDVVLCHDRGCDPVFVYANHCAAALWERPAASFIGWPSRLTAPPGERAERAVALAGDDQVVRGYSGVRIASSGRLFRIAGATVWPVRDLGGVIVGQAATFRCWADL